MLSYHTAFFTALCNKKRLYNAGTLVFLLKSYNEMSAATYRKLKSFRLIQWQMQHGQKKKLNLKTIYDEQTK